MAVLWLHCYWSPRSCSTNVSRAFLRGNICNSAWNILLCKRRALAPPECSPLYPQQQLLSLSCQPATYCCWCLGLGDSWLLLDLIASAKDIRQWECMDVFSGTECSCEVVLGQIALWIADGRLGTFAEPWPEISANWSTGEFLKDDQYLV